MDIIEQDSDNAGTRMLADIGLPREVYTNQVAFIRAVREGLSGRMLQKAVNILKGDRDVFVRLLETDSGNLHRLYKKKALGRAQTEEILDTLKIYVEAARVFGDQEIAKEWLHSEVRALGGSRPVDLFDTFAGRDMVRDVLGKIESGEFS
ncbi:MULTISPECIES: antitoxin Xre/MbcA/ParS toxin-binding domain-containing protein [unclassified Halomonas]|uniref:antitoxin Xre/MbcA/ParS toxin-binding domain-containing protein n=1 Tax=unclassified Halomonas TaxID=2609666 RepID=UPI002469345D|nr:MULTISPECIES: antitoxin Xre/MbcA/ParS toxin-binding domain-containing protein [unclassified Halomonas]